jgi:hypothetical protein
VKRHRVLLSAALLALAAPQVVAQTYDAVADFSAVTNQGAAGAWSYGQSPTRGGTFSLLPNADPAFSGAAGVQAWRGGVPGFQGGYPVIARNGSGATATYLTITHPADLLNLHPGPGGENAVLRWTAPTDGLFRVQGRFQGIDSAPTTTDVAVLLNGLTTLFSSGINVSGGGNVANFDLTVPVAAGDRIDFSVGTGNGFYGNDSTGLRAVIGPAAAATVPEPGTVALLLPAAALTRARRRPRRAAEKENQS